MRRSLLGIVAAAALIAPLLTAVPASAADPLPNGLSSRTAAGSCWEAKQNYPSSADGVYWLLTPALKAPEQFYCDMTTDGGGWVLVGRGREGWKGQYNGLRTPAILRDTVDGPSAFRTAQLPAKTVDALLNNGAVSALPDGIRFRRAKTIDGSQRQEVRFTMPKRDRWVWTFRAEHQVGTFNFDGVTGSGGQTANFGTDSTFRRVDTAIPSTQGYVGGFAYGSQVRGSTSASSYLWSNTEGLGAARPFTQIYLRPKLTIAGMTFPTIPNSGAPAETLRAIPESDAMPTVWGVAGLANGTDGELNTEVSAFGQVGNRVYVGGNFATVQRTLTSTGTSRVAQPFLAAFDVNTGEFISGFRPVLNNQVKAIVGLPDGRLAVGGHFTTVNGAPRASFVVLDAATGATSGWQVDAENRTTGGVSQVRGFSQVGNWLYMSGAFTHLVPSAGSTASAWNGARINLTTGRPDTDWNPSFNGTSVGIEAAPAGDRAYFSGYFRSSGNVPTISASAIQTTAGANVVQPVWAPKFSKSGTDASGNVTGNVWQLGIAEAGGKVWLGGSEHSLFTYGRSAFDRQSGNITKNGGDFQTVEAAGSLVFAGCHCGDFTYSNAFAWSGVGTDWTQADNINLLGAWDAATGAYVPEWNPIMQARRGFGAWASFVDSRGNLWTGGDYKYSTRAGEVNQWSGGFVRFAPRDTVAPQTPGNFSAAPAGSMKTLTWSASTDDGGSVQYEVIRENKVVAVTSALETQVPVESGLVRYFVRAIDTAGNRSATSPVLVVAPPDASELSFIASGASWKWRFDSATLPSNWRAVGFDDSAWSSGSSVLGFGTTAIATNIADGAPAPRPLSAQFRRAFNVTDRSTIVNGQVSVIADDGVIVYVNGTEVGRANLGTGTVSQGSYATSAPRSPAAASSRYVFNVPTSVLVEGQNVVSASTHMNYRSTPDATFDLRFTAERGDAPNVPAAPAAPVVTATSVTTTAASISWVHDPDSAVVEYRVSRDGAPVGTIAAPQSSFAADGLSPDTEYKFVVVAVDSFGQQSGPGSVTLRTAASPVDPVDPTVKFVESGADWTWRYESTPLPADWNAPSFDDAAWKHGASLLGLNTPGQATDIAVGAPSPRPLSAQFRTSFNVGAPSDFATASLTVIANDGVVVYVNGTEVGRSNLPAGNLTQNSYATAAPRSTTAAASRATFEIPVALLVAGTNVIAASTHANYRSSTDLSFDLALSGTR